MVGREKRLKYPTLNEEKQRGKCLKRAMRRQQTDWKAEHLRKMEKQESKMRYYIFQKYRGS